MHTENGYRRRWFKCYEEGAGLLAKRFKYKERFSFLEVGRSGEKISEKI
jgi:hypothetical protein